MLRPFAIVAFVLLGCSVLGQSNLTVDDIIAKTSWMKSKASMARATFIEKTVERNQGETTNYEVQIDWAVSGSKTYRKEMARKVNAKESLSYSTSIFDGENSISLLETKQKDGTIERQVSKAPIAVRVTDIFSGCYKIHDLLLPDALASKKYNLVSSDSEGICFDGPYQAQQRIRFWLSPENGYLVKRQEIYGDKNFAQTQVVEKFGKVDGIDYPLSGKMTVFFEGSTLPTISTITTVASYSNESVSEKLFQVEEAGSVVTDSISKEIYTVDTKGKNRIGNTVAHDSRGGPPIGGSPYGMALLTGFSLLMVGFGLRIRSKIARGSDERKPHL